MKDNQTEFKIEKGIPIPKHRQDSKFPFSEMEIGDSFIMGPAKKATCLRTSASYAGRKYNFKFSVRAVGDVVRCWRIA